ncbi:MAG: nucleotide pyrophosphohydrolase [Actinobacteria bacterium]|nr:nucleotide pyrophosphohydrolase [Actinomycetota bacterium]
MDLEDLRDRLRSFAAERDWDQFHTPRNLILALVGEVGELAELVQWRTDAELAAEGIQSEDRRAIGDEIADILIYLVRLADVLDLDLSVATERKLEANAARYAVGKIKGSAEKQPHD